MRIKKETKMTEEKGNGKEIVEAKTETLSMEKMFELYKEIISPGSNLTNNEFIWYVDYCRRRGFDPLSKDIYLVPRNVRQFDGSYKRVLTPQCSIDAFRKRATQHEGYRGQSGPIWCARDGVWKDVWLLDDPPYASKVGVWRKGFKEPVWGVTKYSEYVQRDRAGKPTDFWVRMASNQLAKCAESLALRKAFPEMFSGMYTKEEMEQAQAAEIPSKFSAESKEVIDVQPVALQINPETGKRFHAEEKIDPGILRSRLREKWMQAISFGQTKKGLEEDLKNIVGDNLSSPEGWDEHQRAEVDSYFELLLKALGKNRNAVLSP